MKTCKVCLLTKSILEFTRDSRNKNGLGAKCRQCYRNRQKELYPKHRRKRTAVENEQHRISNKRWAKTLKGWAQIIINGCRSRAKTYKMSCTLIKDDIIELWHKQNGLCAITHQPMDYKAVSRSHNIPSIDRINNNDGYNISNIRLVWHFVNQARNSYTDEQFIAYCKAVVDNNK